MTAAPPSTRPRAPAEVLDSRTRTRAGLRPRDVLFRLYLATLFGPVAFFLVGDVVTGFATLVGAPFPLAGPAAGTRVTAALAAACAVAVAATVHTGVWRGPFPLDRADVAWLLAGPLPRGALLRPRLGAAALRSGGLGAIAGAVAGPLAATALDGATLPAVVAGGTGGACLGLLCLAGAWWPVLRPEHATRVLRAATAGGGLAVACAGAALAVPALTPIVAWTGPWGWAATAATAATAGEAVPAVGLLAVSALAALVALHAVLASAGRAPSEGLARTTGAAAGAAAAAFMLDFAAVAEVRREALDALRPSPRLRLPPPSRPSLAVAWRDATSLLRAPGRTLAALAGAAAGAAFTVGGFGVATSGAAEPPWRAPALIAAGAVVAQLAAGALVSPLRSAMSRPFGHLHLPWSHLALVRRHLAVPTLVLAAWAALAAGSAAGALGAPGPPLVALAAALAAPVLVLAAALQVLRPPRAPTEIAESVLGNEYGALAFILRRWHRLLVPAGLASAVDTLAGAELAPLAVVALLVAAAAGACALAWWRLGRKAAPWQ